MKITHISKRFHISGINGKTLIFRSEAEIDSLLFELKTVKEAYFPKFYKQQEELKAIEYAELEKTAQITAERSMRLEKKKMKAKEDKIPYWKRPEYLKEANKK